MININTITSNWLAIAATSWQRWVTDATHGIVVFDDATMNATWVPLFDSTDRQFDYDPTREVLVCVADDGTGSQQHVFRASSTAFPPAECHLLARWGLDAVPEEFVGLDMKEIGFTLARGTERPSPR